MLPTTSAPAPAPSSTRSASARWPSSPKSSSIRTRPSRSCRTISPHASPSSIVCAREAMRRIVIHRAGGYERLVLETHRSQPLPPEHVRIAVRAIGVNYADCIVRMGLYASARRYVGWPITPGFEVAGDVAEIADDIGDLRVG